MGYSGRYLSEEGSDRDWVEFMLRTARSGVLPVGFIDVNQRTSLLEQLVQDGFIQSNNEGAIQKRWYSTTDAGLEYLQALMEYDRL